MFHEGSFQVTWYNASGKRCVDDVRDGRQEDVKVFIKKRGGNGIKFTRCQGFHKEAWWEWDEVHKTLRVHC